MRLFDALAGGEAGASAVSASRGEVAPLPAGVVREGGADFYVPAGRLISECDKDGGMVSGDIAASYSADLLATKKGDGVRKPFLFGGCRYVATYLIPRRRAGAYRLLAPSEYISEGGVPGLIGADGYDGVTVSYRGDQFVLAGPQVTFEAEQSAHCDESETDDHRVEPGACAHLAGPPARAAQDVRDVAGDWPEASLIAAAPDADFLLPKIPADRQKARDMLTEFLERQRLELSRDISRYEDIRARGAAALSAYDVDIAAAGDGEQAVRTALRLKTNHISNGKALVAKVSRLLATDYAAAPTLFDPEPTDPEPTGPNGGRGRSRARGGAQPGGLSGAEAGMQAASLATARGAVASRARVARLEALGVTVYRSGSSARADFKGFSEARVPVGVEIGELSGPGMELVARYNDSGGAVFVDNGSFAASRSTRPIDFDKVFARYGELAARLPNKDLAAFVMPDVVGDQDATLELIARYAEKVREFIRLGLDVLVPIQKGRLSLVEAYRKTVEIIGSADFRAAFPSKRAAVSDEELIDFIRHTGHARIHLLGIGKQARLVGLVESAREQWPALDISSDANFLRAMVGRGRALTLAVDARIDAEVIDAALDGEPSLHLLDDTEMLAGVYNDPLYLSARHASQLAEIATDNPGERAEIIKAACSSEPGFHYGSRLGDVLDRICPGQVGDQVVWTLQRLVVKSAIRPRVRAEEITKASLTCRVEIEDGRPMAA